VAPSERGRPSVKDRCGAWQLRQEYWPVTERRGSANNFPPNATFAALIGLSAGTAGCGNPRGSSQAYGVTAVAVLANSVSNNARRTRRRLVSHAAPRESRSLAGDGAAFTHPGRERVERCAVDTARIAAMLAHPGLHSRQQLRRQLAIAAEQREVGVLRIIQAIEAEIGVAAILDCFGVARLQRQCTIVRRERGVVLAELAVGIAHVVPGLVHRRVELGGTREFLECAGIPAVSLVERLGLVLRVRLVRRISGDSIGLLHELDAGVVSAARLLFG